MALTKHILIDDELERFLTSKKKYPRETYNDVLRRLLKIKSGESQ